jgi:hypothetical protein
LPEGRISQSNQWDAESTNIITAVDEESDPKHNQVENEHRDIDVVTDNIAISDEEKDLTRQSGDVDLYKYYYKTIGFRRFSVFILFCILNVFSGSFSGMLPVISLWT